MKIYLLLNALFYLLLAVWCTVQHTKASAASGFVTLDNSGHSEYLVIYGGLQLGLALFYTYVATHTEYLRLGVLFSVFLYASIVVFRVVTILKFNPVGSITLATGALELALLIAGAALWLTKKAD